MAPPSASSSTARKAASRPAHEPRHSAPRPFLRVVPGRRPGARTRLLTVVAVALVVGSLLVVVVGQAMLANGQVRLTAVEQRLATEESVHRQAEVTLAGLEAPARIVAEALGVLHMVHATQPTQLPFVPLTTPLAPPTVTPAAPTTPPAGG